MYGPFTPTGGEIPQGGGWLTSNIMNFPDGRVGVVSAPNAGVGTGPACSATYCKYLRLYNVTRTGNSLTFVFDRDITLADSENGWPDDDHGMATDGTYLYQIKYNSGYKVWQLSNTVASTIVFNGSGSGNCGAATDISGGMCNINTSVGWTTLSPNATFFGRSHATNQYIMGDYSGNSRFWTSDSVAPPAGIGSDVTAPVLSAQTASSITQTTATLNFTSGEAGTYYYLVYASASSPPDTATIVAQGASSPTIVKGTSSATVDTNTVAVTGLSAGTSYKAYVVVKDSSGNVSLVSTISLTTAVANPAFSLSASSETRTYSTSGTAFTSTSTGGLIASYSISATPAGMSFDTSTGALTGAPTTIAAATTYTVTATNASGTATRSFVLTVTARPITIKAAAKSATYTGSSVSVSNSYSISVGSLVGSDTFTVSTYTYSSAGYSASQTAPTNAGSYTITPSAASFSIGSASNYSITYDTATLTIGVAAQAALTLSSTSGTYGTTLILTTNGGSGTGAVTYSTGTAGCTIANTDSLTVTSALTCSVTATKAADSNYTATSSSATNVVFGARPISIKADAKSGTYTGSSVSVTNSYTISSGTLAGTDTFTALTYTYSSASYSSSPTAPTNAGSYTITPSAATFSVGSASNYSITYETATLTVSKASQGALTITTSTSKYGTPLNLRTSGGSGTGALSFAITSAGTASGCSISTETLTVSSFGTCKVTATKALDTNYNVVSSAETIITFAKADTITVTTTLSTSSVTYTESPAAITATQTVTGLVNSETGTITTTYTGYSCEYGGTCVIGDVAPGGGYVFYVSATTIDVASGISTGGIYLATAPQTWGGGSVDPTAKWGCSSTISGTFSSAVGSGAENTRLITAGCATSGIAARLAADASAEGFTDWFVPSIGELNLIYTNLKLNSLSNLNGTDYWSSTQDASSPSSYAQYQWFGGGSYGPTDKNNTLYVRAIRAFSPTALATNTIPTDAGVYKVGSTFAISSPASLGNYLAVESVTATLTINKARQKTITIGQYDAYPNISSYPLNVYGGSGPGTVTRTLVSAGTAGCSLASTFILTATSTGTCTVKAEKAGTRNYIVESTTAVIYWIAWSNNYTAQTIEGNHAISVSGSNGIVVRTETVTASAFSNTSGGAITSAAIGTTIRINSTGFSGLSPSDLSVTFRPYEDAVISAVTSTYVEVVIPAGASTGVIAIDSPRGVAYTQSFTIAP